MKNIITESENLIVQPTLADYRLLGLKLPEKSVEIITPTAEELRQYGDVDFSYGVPLRTRSLFAARETGLFAPKDEDFRRLGIERSLIVDENDFRVRIRSYGIGEDGFAYTCQKSEVLIDALAAASRDQINTDGFVSFRLPQYGWAVVIFEPKALELQDTKLGSTLYPKADSLQKVLDSGRKLAEWETVQGLQSRLIA